MNHSHPPRDLKFTVLGWSSAGVVEDAALCYGYVLLLKWFLTHVVVIIKPADVLRRPCFVFLIRKRWQLDYWVCKINSTCCYIYIAYNLSRFSCKKPSVRMWNCVANQTDLLEFDGWPMYIVKKIYHQNFSSTTIAKSSTLYCSDTKKTCRYSLVCKINIQAHDR